MSGLSIPKIFDSSLAKLHASFTNDAINSSNFFETDEYKSFQQKQATKLAKPLKAENKQDGLLDFLDLCFRISVAMKQEGCKGDPKATKDHLQFEKILDRAEFFTQETIETVKFLHNIEYEFSNSDIGSLITGFCDSSKEAGFDKEAWFGNIRLFANEKNLNEGENSKHILSHDTFIYFESDDLELELTDFLIELGADIYSANSDQVIISSIEDHPKLIKHLLANYPKFKQDSSRLLRLSRQALLSFINDHLGDLDGSELKRTSTFHGNSQLLKMSFNELSQAGIPIDDPEIHPSPSWCLKLALVNGALESGTVQLMWGASESNEERIPILAPSLDNERIDNVRAKLRKIQEALEL